MPLERHIAAFENQAEVLATMDVAALWDRLRGEYLDAFVRFDRQGLKGEALERELQAFMDGLSEKPIEKLARGSSSVAYNQGRAAEILSQESVRFVVRSEVLDPRTCGPCRDLDGFIAEIGTPEFDEYQPPAKCEGLTNCRGFYIAVAEA